MNISEIVNKLDLTSSELLNIICEPLDKDSIKKIANHLINIDIEDELRKHYVNVKMVALKDENKRIFELFFIDGGRQTIEVKTLKETVDENLLHYSDDAEKIKFLCDLVLNNYSEIGVHTKINKNYWVRTLEWHGKEN